jgi:hypothetical protein
MKHFALCLFLVIPALAMAQAVETTPPVIDHVTIQVSDSLAFTIPMTDPKWEKYKGYLPSLTLNSQIWDKLALTMGRTDLEMRLHDEIAQAYVQARNQVQQQTKTQMSELTQAAYVAKQPNATEAQKANYAALSAKDGPILNKATAPLMAIHLLLQAIEADTHMKPGYSGLANGKVVPKPGTNTNQQ